MDNNTKTKLTETEMDQVKGGPVFAKYDGVDGESAAHVDPHKKWSDILTIGFRRR